MITVDTCGFFVHQAERELRHRAPEPVGDRAQPLDAGDGLGVGEPTGEPAVPVEGGA